MKILTINYTHDASVCLAEDGALRFYSKEERFSRRKRDPVPCFCLHRLHDRGWLTDLDEIVVCNWLGYRDDQGYLAYYDGLRRRLAPGSRLTAVWGEHHLFHAYNAFSGSGFDEALVFVIDTAGATLDPGGAAEKQSVYRFDRTGHRVLYRHVSRPCTLDGGELHVAHEGICDRYDRATRTLGLDILDAGKTMGLSSYGRPVEVTPELPVASAITRDNYQPYADLALDAQTRTFGAALDLIRTWIAQTGITRICVTGGYGMNSVANLGYVRALGPECTVYADPLADDGGITIGMARMLGGAADGPLSTLCFSGFAYDLSAVGGVAASPDEVVERLLRGQVGAIFQGHAEAGARALGNRSILFDPRARDGRDVVNTVKRREWYRPFAATALEDHAGEWFDLRGLGSNPFMTSVVPTWPEQIPRIPAVTHVDGTCRVQTLRREQNPHLHALIERFHAATGVPMLLNTSFNLAGEPLVETSEDALSTLRRSALDFVWFPEVARLVERRA